MFIAMIVASFACADPIPKAAPEPAWMANFRKVYELKEGQYVKRVAAPYIRERIDFMVDAYAPPINLDADERRRDMYFRNAKWFAVIIEQNGTNLKKRMTISAMGLSLMPTEQRGDNLFEVSRAVSTLTGMNKPEFIIDPRYVNDPLFEKDNLTVQGDFVIRKNAPIEKLAEQLESILRNECKVPCKLRVDMVEQEVYVVSGTFKLSPPEWRKTSENPRLKQLIDIYATKDGLNPEYDRFLRNQKGNTPNSRVSSNEFGGSLIDLMRLLGERLDQRIVWDQELPSEPRIDWCNHTIRNPTPQEKADDTDPAKVLKNMENQIGLTFKKEKRKVPVLVIYPSELK